MRSLVMARLENPTPRPLAFQAKRGPSASHCFSNPVSVDRLSRFGPRNWGQLGTSAAADWAAGPDAAIPMPAASTTTAVTCRPRVMRMRMAPDRNTHDTGRVFRRVTAGRYHSLPPDAQGAAVMSGSPSSSRRLFRRVLPLPLAVVALATYAAGQTSSTTPLRLHGL